MGGALSPLARFGAQTEEMLGRTIEILVSPVPGTTALLAAIFNDIYNKGGIKYEKAYIFLKPKKACRIDYHFLYSGAAILVALQGEKLLRLWCTGNIISTIGCGHDFKSLGDLSWGNKE
jgi:hypothetical protein